MPLDVYVDKGQVENETEEMRQKREEILAKTPPPQFFKLSAQLLKQGRSNKILADTGTLWLNLKVYAGGGENGLHNHSDEDHAHIVMQGSACFFGPRGEERHCGPYEGVMLPAGAYYRFHATSEEPLVLLRVGCWHKKQSGNKRFNIYGEALPAEAKGNGQVEVIPLEGQMFGPPTK